MTLFGYDPAVIERYPNVVGGVVVVDGLRNGPTPPELAGQYEAEQRAVRERIGETPLSQLPSLAAWRSAFRGFGVDPTQYRSAAEALLRRLTKAGSIPSINTLVDLGNLLSIRYALPVAVFDRRGIGDGLTVRFATGAERFTPLGEAAVEHPEPGEVIFSDREKQVAARRWCWRQSAESASREDTTAVLIAIEGQHDGARQDIEQAVSDLRSLLGVAGGTIARSEVLDTSHPALTG